MGTTSDDLCQCCEKRGHRAEKCKAPFSKRWPGKHAIKLTLRNPDGVGVEYVAGMSEEDYRRGHEFLRSLFKSSAERESGAQSEDIREHMPDIEAQ